LHVVRPGGIVIAAWPVGYQLSALGCQLTALHRSASRKERGQHVQQSADSLRFRRRRPPPSRWADRTTLLISAGGFGVGPIEHLMTALLQLRHEAQVVAICGRSETLYQRVQRIAAERPAGGHVSIHPVGYTTEMDEYMAAADLVVGQPGGLTTSEALARGLVFVIVNPIPGQEERNSDHLLEQGRPFVAITWPSSRTRSIASSTTRLVWLACARTWRSRPNLALPMA